MKKTYTDEQITAFLELAQDIGYTRAMRELGYPNSWATANRWAEKRGVTIAVDEVKARAAKFNQWYDVEENMLVAQEGINRVYEELTTNKALSADDMKKLADAYAKYVATMQTLQGKASNITESRTTDSMDENIMELLAMEKAKNATFSTYEPYVTV